METQTALAIPDEDNTLVVYSSSQYPEFAQRVIARCLGIPFSNVRVITRRVGGGFGGKAFKSFQVRIRETSNNFKSFFSRKLNNIKIYSEREIIVLLCLFELLRPMHV